MRWISCWRWRALSSSGNSRAIKRWRNSATRSLKLKFEKRFCHNRLNHRINPEISRVNAWLQSDAVDQLEGLGLFCVRSGVDSEHKHLGAVLASTGVAHDAIEFVQ